MTRLFYLTLNGGGASLWRWRPRAFAWAAVLLPWAAVANPTHPVVTQGSASFSTQGSQFTIHTSGNAAINWAGFNIGTGETTTFVEPSSHSVVWNHITDPNPSQILGHLDANGYVILENQSGFYVGGNAVITAAGLVMTTARVAPLDVFGSGSWDFSAPPPTASIINYGEINAGPAGSVFLISHDIQNSGIIAAPAGHIGLYSGQDVLVSTRADGRGFSADVTLPQGSVDNSGKLLADAGTIALNAQVVNQGGMIQANTVRNNNGEIDIVASGNITLGANSIISAKGDTQGVSAGGQVTIKSGGTYGDTSTSIIDVSGGAQGGNGGVAEVSAEQVTAIQSQIIGAAQPGWVGGYLSIDPVNIQINTTAQAVSTIADQHGDPSGTLTVDSGDAPSTLVINPSAFSSFSQIDLQASGIISLGTTWTLPAETAQNPGTLTLQAGGNIVLADNVNGIGDMSVGANWTVNLIAGANFNTPTSVTALSSSTSSSILMNGRSSIQFGGTALNMIAGGGITTTTGSIQSTGGGSILMQAYGGGITLGPSTSAPAWAIQSSGAPGPLTLQSAGAVTLNSGIQNTAGGNINITSGQTVGTSGGNAVFAGIAPNTTSGSINMNGASSIQTTGGAGSVDLTAAGGITTATGTIQASSGNVTLQAYGQAITLGAKTGAPSPILQSSGASDSIIVESEGNVTLYGGIQAGTGESVEVMSGANPAFTGVTPVASGASITLNGGAGIQSADQNIELIAGGGISTGNGSISSTGGAIIMEACGQGITLGGNVNNLPATGAATSILMESAGSITLNGNLTGGQDCSVDLLAGANSFSTTPPAFSTTSVSGVNSTTVAGVNSITVGGNQGILTAAGNIDVLAGGGITTSGGATMQTSGGSILLQAASQDLTLGGTAWRLPDSPAPTSVTLQSGARITINGGIMAGANWGLNLISGATFGPDPDSVNNNNSGSVVLGSSFLQTGNGDINITAAGSVVIGLYINGVIVPESGAICTGVTLLDTDLPGGGGNITVDAVGGSVNTGDNTSGYSFRLGPQYTVPGGISTAAGGNVTITAAGDITSYLPLGIRLNPTDAGSGAFGPEPGIVTITAGGNVYGHYVAADSVDGPSTITAENGNAGSAGTGIPVANLLALSLGAGSWVVNAPNGSINLQEVRNSYGTLDGIYSGSQSVMNNIFNYAPNASVTLDAGNAVNLLGNQNLPRYTSEQTLPILYPPSLTINSGAGGVSLAADVTLFPSPDGELTINTTGSFQGNGNKLIVSDYGPSAAQLAGGILPNQWTSATDFQNGHAPTPIQLNNPQPVVFNIGGDLNNVTLVMPKQTQVTVGGNMIDVSFNGQNLHSGDTSFFHVAGNIIDESTYAFAPVTPPLTLPAPFYHGGIANDLQLLLNAVVPGSGPASANAGALFPGLELFYLQTTGQLGYYGIMPESILSQFLGTLQEKTYTPGGQVILNPQGLYVTKPATFAASSGPTAPLYQALQALYQASQQTVNPAAAPSGLVLGGPGQFDVTAKSIDLGASKSGISSVGPANNPALVTLPGKGAQINVTTTGDLDLFASQISSVFGGAVDVNAGGAVNAGGGQLPFQGQTPHGIWTAGGGNVSVIAQGNINVDGSRIATFDSGNIFVESTDGDVNAGTGDFSEIEVDQIIVNPKTGAVETIPQFLAGSGILALTLPDAKRSLQVGNITVETPHGNINAGLGGITQEPENKNTSLTPTVNLSAGGDINAGNTGVIAVNVNAQAGGQITGLFISSGNSTIQSASSIDVTVFAGGSASLSTTGGGTISGLAIAGGGLSFGGGKFEGVALSQNVSGGGATSALASSASAGAGSQTSAAGEASSQKSETSDQPTSTDQEEDLKHRKGRPLLAKYTGRVTVLLPPVRQ